jgi:hypothetical protein
MADNVLVDNGDEADYTVSADEGVGGQVQRVKLAYAADGSETHIPADADGLLVNLGTNNDVTVSGVSTAANQTTVIGHLDGVEGLLTTIDADTGVLSASVSSSKVQTQLVGDDGATKATVRDYTTSNPLAVAITDSTGAQVTPIEAYTEDSAAAANPVGPMTMLRRKDTLSAAEVTTDGDNIAANANSAGALYTEIVSGTAKIPGDATNGLDVDVTRLPALAAGTNNIGDVDVLSVVPGTSATSLGKAEDAGHNTGDTGVFVLSRRIDTPATSSGTDADYSAFNTNAEGGLWVAPTPSASGGCTIFRSIDLDESEEEVKASAGTVYGWAVTNTATSTRWLKFYNATAANVTVGTTTPVITWGIPGNSSDDISANMLAGMGIKFDTAITVAATTGVLDNDTGAPGANEVIVNIFYK